MHCFCFGPFGNHQGFVTSMQLASALAVEAELQETRRKEEIEKSAENRHESTRRDSKTTAALRDNRW
jgi:hypothetical protein